MMRKKQAEDFQHTNNAPFLDQCGDKKVFKLHIYVLHILLVIFHNTKYAHAEICPLYTEWKKANYKICIVQVN